MSPERPTAEETAAQLRPTLGRLYRRIRQTKALGDLTLAESSALSQLRGGPRTAAELAKLERITPQSMGTTVAALLDRGLIDRRADPADGRRHLLSLSPTGNDAVNARRDRRDRQIAAALEGLSPAERRHLLDAVPLLAKLTERLADLDPSD